MGRRRCFKLFFVVEREQRLVLGSVPRAPRSAVAGREGEDGAGDGLAVAELFGVLAGDILRTGTVSELGLRDILERLIGTHLVHA